MSNQNVTITIDLEHKSTRKALAGFFSALAGDEGGCPCKPEIGQRMTVFPTKEVAEKAIESRIAPQTDAPPPPPAPEIDPVIIPSGAPPNAEELDAEGYPHDPEIDVASKAKLKNGIWRRKRTTSVVDIIASKAKYDGQDAPPPIVRPSAQALPDAPPPPPEPELDAPPMPPEVANFAELLGRVNELIASGLRAMDDIDQIAKNNGLESLAFVATVDPGDPVFRKIVEEIG